MRRHDPVRLLAIGFCFLALGVIAGFVRVEQIANRQEAVIEIAAQERRENVRKFSEANENVVSAIRTMLCTLRKNTLTSNQRTAAEKQQVIRFYQVALDSVDAAPCDPP